MQVGRHGQAGFRAYWVYGYILQAFGFWMFNLDLPLHPSGGQHVSLGVNWGPAVEDPDLPFGWGALQGVPGPYWFLGAPYDDFLVCVLKICRL